MGVERFCLVHNGRASAGGTGVKTARRLLSCVQVRLKVPVGCVRLPRLSCMPLPQLSTARTPTGSVEACQVGWMTVVYGSQKFAGAA